MILNTEHTQQYIIDNKESQDPAKVEENKSQDRSDDDSEQPSKQPIAETMLDEDGVYDLNKSQKSNPFTGAKKFMANLISSKPESQSTRNADKSDDENPSSVPTCSICLESYKHGDDICTSKDACKHEFHLLCMMDWLLWHNKCPICRSQFLDTDNSIEDTNDADADADADAETDNDADAETETEDFIGDTPRGINNNDAENNNAENDDVANEVEDSQRDINNNVWNDDTQTA